MSAQPDIELLQRVHAAGEGGLEVVADSDDHNRGQRMARPDTLFAWVFHKVERPSPHTTKDRYFVNLTPAGRALVEGGAS